MTFQEEEVGNFLEVFETTKEKIRSFSGCNHLELWQDEDRPNVYMTYSHWDGPEALEAYRHSELFKRTWAKTKPLFADRPQAFSARRKMVAKVE